MGLGFVSCENNENPASDADQAFIAENIFIYEGDTLQFNSTDDYEFLQGILDQENVHSVFDAEHQNVYRLFDNAEEFMKYELKTEPNRANEIKANYEFIQAVQTRNITSKKEMETIKRSIFNKHGVSTQTKGSTYSEVRIYEHGGMNGSFIKEGITGGASLNVSGMKSEPTHNSSGQYIGYQNWNDRVSSLWFRGYDKKPWLAIYEHENFKGKSGVCKGKRNGVVSYNLSSKTMIFKLFKKNVSWQDQMSSYTFGSSY